MNSYAISSRNLDQAKEKASEIAKKEGVGNFDLTFFDFEKDLGIEDVRNIQKTIFLTPFKGDKKAVFLVLQKQATTEAQNSMLKLLEEPPPGTFIFLISKNSGFFLPTILSRVKLIQIENREETKEVEFDQITELKGIEEKLKFAESVSKDKEEALTFLENAILWAREKMINASDNRKESLRIRKMIHSLEVAHYDLKNTNVNPRLSIEHALFDLP